MDPDSEARTFLTRYLECHDFRVTPVADAIAMRRALECIHADLVVLDVLPENKDGFATCRDLRARSQIPVIIVSSRAEDIDRIIGLELGADDFLRKPYNPRELLVRIRAVLRRSSRVSLDPTDGNIRAFRFNGWVLDTTTGALTDPNGRGLPLRRAEYRLLTVLLCASNRVVSREQLSEVLRGRKTNPSERSTDVLVSRVRQILQEDARVPRIIKTVYGHGYVIGVAVQFD
jgi:two-component system OmpR family response regulator